MRMSKFLIMFGTPLPALPSLPIVPLDRVEVPLARASSPRSCKVVVLSLVEALPVVSEPWKPRGVHHRVLAVLLLGVCAVLAAVSDLFGVRVVVRMSRSSAVFCSRSIP